MWENFVRMIMYHFFMEQKNKSLKFIGSKKRIQLFYLLLVPHLTSFANWFEIMWVRFSIMTLAYIEFEEKEMRIESKSYLISLTNWFKTCDLVLKIFPIAQI